MKSSFQNTRRGFMKTTAALGVGYWASDRASADDAPTTSPSEKINFACIGVEGKGSSDAKDASDNNNNNIVALCDVDESKLEKAAERYPDAKIFFDYREMFDEMAGKIDAVTVSTPDHLHGVASVRAMREGKAVYCQKPLTHSIWEARRMGEIAREMKVATQMGNQGTAGGGLRRSAAVIQSGALGPVQEVHVWTDRPIWPQGGARPAAKPVPKALHWNLWLGPAAKRDYGDGYHPFAWRGWWDFGTGALGDMACHTMNLPYMALDLRDPISVQAETAGHNGESYPKWSIITYQFAATDKRPAVKMVWYDGGQRPPLSLLEGEEINKSASLTVGEKGKLYSPDDYGGAMKLIGDVKAPDDLKFTESPGHMQELIRAIKGGPAPVSNFPDYSGPLTEMVLLGNLAVWTAGSGSGPTIEWDAKALRAKNATNLESLIKPEFRAGYSI